MPTPKTTITLKIVIPPVDIVSGLKVATVIADTIRSDGNLKVRGELPVVKDVKVS